MHVWVVESRIHRKWVAGDSTFPTRGKARLHKKWLDRAREYLKHRVTKYVPQEAKS